MLSEPIKSWRNYSSSLQSPVTIETLKNNSINNYNEHLFLTPGLTTRPPLPYKSKETPKKNINTKEKLDGNPIHDYLAIKYNQKFEENFSNDLGNEEIMNAESETASATFEDTQNNAIVFNQIVKDVHIQNWMKEETEDEQFTNSNPSQKLSEINFDKLFDSKTTTKLENINKNTTLAKSRVKFSAVPLRSSTDCEESPAIEEIETWMSKKNNKNIIFKDIINNINEIEKSICLNPIDMPQDAPQHDIETTPEPESCDDISSILKVLEEEDKKSRNFLSKH